MADIVDLDALVPQSVTLKIGGGEITLNPPKTSDVLMLGKVSQKLQNLENLSQEEMDSAIAGINSQLVKIIPELSNQPDLSMAQLLKLIEIISTMSTPPDAKELEKRGIKPIDTKKKEQ